MKNDKLWRSKKKARKLRKSRPGTLRRGTFELPEGRCELTGALLDALGAPRTLRPGVLRRPLGDAPERLGELSVSSRESPGTLRAPLESDFRRLGDGRKRKRRHA